MNPAKVKTQSMYCLLIKSFSRSHSTTMWTHFSDFTSLEATAEIFVAMYFWKNCVLVNSFRHLLIKVVVSTENKQNFLRISALKVGYFRK